jgi:hypothetical protein
MADVTSKALAAAPLVNIAAWGSIALGIVANVPGLTWPANFVWIAADNKPSGLRHTRRPSRLRAGCCQLRDGAGAERAHTQGWRINSDDRSSSGGDRPVERLATADRYRAGLSLGRPCGPEPRVRALTIL